MSEADEIEAILNPSTAGTRQSVEGGPTRPANPAPARGTAGRGRPSLWQREFPYLLILVLAAAGAGWVSLTRHPIVRYWDVVAVVVASVAIIEGWGKAEDARDRWRLVWTQVLHWAAFLFAMNLVFLPSMQAVLTQDALSLTVLLLLGLGTFVSGVHTLSPLMALNGLFMALCVPGIAWLDQATLVIFLAVVVLASIVALFFWLRRRTRAHAGA